MALEAAVYHEQDLFCHNNNGNFNKDLYPLLLEAWSNTNYINNDDSFLPFLKFQDHLQDPSFTTPPPPPNDFDNCSYFHDNTQLEFDWHSYYYHYGVHNNTNNNHNDDTVIPSPTPLVTDLMPPLNNYDHECCWGLVNSSSPDEEPKVVANNEAGGVPVVEEVVMRPKQRRRARAKKNEKEIENQRMTHIAVERNRRKQMNEYLNVLRSLMPDSYVQRGDQASIVGAAINFVKELEHNVQSLSAKKQMKEKGSCSSSSGSSSSGSTSSLPFGEFFTFPQFSSNGDYSSNNNSHDDDQMKSAEIRGPQHDHAGVQAGGGVAADVEVTMVECHAHLKIRLRQPPKHLSKLVSGLHSLRLCVLHLNVNTADDGVVLYSFSLKVEDESKLNSVDEIAKAVYLLLGRIQEETNSV